MPSGGDDMASLIDALDWSTTPLGSPEGWSPSLRMMVRFLLANRFPLLLWWGPDYISIYNDAYRPILGTKHPTALGQPVRECWSEIWHILQPLIDTPFRGGPATWMEDIPLEINRHGFTEETHFTVAYSPVPDDTAPNGIGGVLATVHEITEKVIGERRVVALRDLGARLTEAKSVEQACAIAASVLESHARDVPFALFYLIERNGTRARLAGTAGILPETELSPAIVVLDDPADDSVWPLLDAMTRNAPIVVEDFPTRALPPGPWSDPPRRAVVMPVRSNLAHQPAGIMVAGVSPRLRLDDLYRSFFDLVATQLAAANAAPIQDATGRSIAAIATWTDVTAPKNAESQLRGLNEMLERQVEERTATLRNTMQQLAQSERQLRLLLQAVTDYALFMLDRDGVVVSWNPGAQRIKGYQADEIIGQHFSRFYTAEDRARGVPDHVLATAAGEGRFEAEAWRLRKDGSRFWANVVIDVVRDEAGAVIGFVKITRDLTERHALDEQLRQAQKMEALGQLIGGVAHDFNNLLATILPSLEMARDHIDSDTALKYIGHATHAAARGARLTHQLLNFSHKQDLVTRPVDVNQLVGVLCEMLPRTIGPTIEIKTTLDNRLWLAMSEPSQLELAILNLAINGRDAMSLGGTLTIATANVAADSRRGPRELEQQDCVLISVTDTGIGMTEETRRRAFEPFFTTKARDRGTGLGLSMVYALARDSGGAVTIASEVGKGTTVRIYLPRARLTTSLVDRPDEGSALDAGPPSRILVVDDDDGVREVAALMVKGFGHEVVEANSGAAALDILESDKRFDAMIVDLAMPRMHGAVFAISARSLVPGLPTLFVTGYTDPHWLRDISSEQLLKKPFGRLDLATKLRPLLVGRRAGATAPRRVQ
jgi:PAS domain S-box-containing protein